jgi:hypothetical protein
LQPLYLAGCGDSPFCRSVTGERLLESVIDQGWSRCWGRLRPSPAIYIHTYILESVTDWGHWIVKCGNYL